DLNQYINNNPQAIVKTSKNAPDVNIWPITIKIPDNGSTADEILEYCKNQFTPDGGKIIYLSGEPVALDIAEELCKLGFDAEKVITYKQIPSSVFSKSFIDNLVNIKTATFFSIETSKNFNSLVEKHNLQNAIKHINCI